MNTCSTLYANDLVHALDKMIGKKVLIVGDLVLDHYVVGGVDRISPEAPVPVVAVDSERLVLGGAGNVARNIKTLGGEPVIISVCGNDQDGHTLQNLLASDGIESHLICDSSRPTTKKTRIIAQNQQVVRVDWENPDEISSAILSQVMEFLRVEADSSPVIILSDYGKGLITEHFMAELERCLSDLDQRPKVLVDPKVRNFHLYRNVDILTPNTKEAGEGAGFPATTAKADILRAGRTIFERLSNKNLLITLGAGGMALFEGQDCVRRIPTAAKKVFDVTGAGDTVIATLGLALASGMELLTACALANYAAGIVVGEIGTAAVSHERLKLALAAYQDLPVERWA